MGGTLSRKTVCAYCGDVIRDGLPPISHGCCFNCFRARLWDDEGERMLTVDDIGQAQMEKAKNDRARFRGIPGQALQYARERGGEAANRLQWIKEGDYDDTHYRAIANDAITYAMQAFRGWRAYRIMKG